MITFDVFWGFVCSFFCKAKRHSDYMKLNRNYSNIFSFQSEKWKVVSFLEFHKNYLCVIILLLSHVIFMSSCIKKCLHSQIPPWKLPVRKKTHNTYFSALKLLPRKKSLLCSRWSHAHHLKVNIDLLCTYTLVDSATEEFTYLKTSFRNY